MSDEEEYVSIPVSRLRELEELEVMWQEMEDDGEQADKWIQSELAVIRAEKAAKEQHEQQNTTARHGILAECRTAFQRALSRLPSARGD